jgi:hypothetical protein
MVGCWPNIKKTPLRINALFITAKIRLNSKTKTNATPLVVQYGKQVEVSITPAMMKMD